MQPSSDSEAPAGVVDLWLCQVRPVVGSEPADERLLAPGECERATRLFDDEARTLFVLGRSLLRATLSGYLGCAPRDLRFDQRCARCGQQHGKPCLVDPGCELAFNLSHTRGLIALAVCWGGEVGIDVEWRGRAPTMPELARVLLSPRPARPFLIDATVLIAAVVLSLPAINNRTVHAALTAAAASAPTRG